MGLTLSCGSFLPYAKINSSNNLSLSNKKIAILGMNLPVDVREQNSALKLILDNDLIKFLSAQNAQIYKLQIPEEKNIETKIYKNDLYNWFFRSDSFLLETTKSKIDVSTLDYVVEVNIFNYKKGMIRDNDWIEFAILFYSTQDKKLVKKISGKGFYSTVLEKLSAL